MDNLEQLQLELEDWSRQQSEGRCRAYQDKQLKSGAAGQDPINFKLIKTAVPVVAQEIREWLEAHTNRGKGKTHSAVLPLSLLEPERIAILGLIVCFSTIPKQKSVIRTQEAIGQAIKREIWLSGLMEQNPKLAKRLFAQALKRHSSPVIRLKSIRQIAAQEGVYELHPLWTPVKHAKIGEPVLDAILRRSLLFELREPETKSFRTLGFTQEAVDAIDELAWFSARTSLRPPMVVPPTPWPAPPYRSADTNYALKPIRRAPVAQRKALQAAHANGSLDRVYAVLNRLQGVPYAINRRVLDVLVELWNQGERVGKMPRKHALPELHRPENYKELSASEQKRWKIKARGIKVKNAVEIPAQRMLFQRDLYIAEFLAGQTQFYIPVNMCFRGRIYPIPVFHYQLSDPIRGLFRFAIGKPLGLEGFKWLSIHLANCGDFGKVSKRSYQERLNWVAENASWIWECAQDPLKNRKWTEADKPFQFLAAAGEWMEASSLEKPSEYVSYLPIGLDGSNSGMQHYSAIMRSRAEASLVNLIKLPEPADIYETIAGKARGWAQEEADVEALAELWCTYGISRSTVKRSVMTSLYGSGQFGFGNHIFEDLMRPLGERVLDGELAEHPLAVDDDDGEKAARYLASLIDRALKETQTRTHAAKVWLRRVASALAKVGEGVRWVTPIGWPAVNQYDESARAQIEVFLYNRNLSPETATKKDLIYPDQTVRERLKLLVRTNEETKVCSYKQRNTIAPNLIHSMDGAHLMLTVEAAAEAGITSFLTIHDSFGTHAQDVERFSQIIREQFVRMYQNYDPLEDIYRGAKAVLGETIDPPPERGNLDLTEVLESPYFFA